MKIILICLTVSITLSINVNGQKLKKDYTTVKYFRPSTYKSDFSRYYNIVFDEKRKELDGSISEKFSVYSSPNINLPRRHFYHSCFNMIRSLHSSTVYQNPDEKDTISNLYVKTGVLNIIKSEAFSEQIRDAQGKVTGVKWLVAVDVKVPCQITFSDENDNLIYSENSNDLIQTFYYPENFTKVKTQYFTSKQAALNSFNHNKTEYTQFIRDLYIKEFAKKIKKEIHHTVNDDEDWFSVDLAWVKGKGKMKKAYEDIDQLNNRMNDLFSLVKLNFKNDTRLNWHTEEIQKEFKLLQSEYEDILNKDSELKESGKEARFDDIAFIGLYKNVLWCMFFTGQFQEVISTAKELNKQDEENESTFQIETKLVWSNLLEIAKIYQNVYQINMPLLNWY